MPLDNVPAAIAAIEKRLDAAEEKHGELYREHKTMLDDFARLRGRHRDLLELLQRVYPDDSTIGAAVKRLREGSA